MAEKLTTRLELYDENGLQVPGYLEVDVAMLMGLVRRSPMVEATLGVSAKIVKIGKAT